MITVDNPSRKFYLVEMFEEASQFPVFTYSDFSLIHMMRHFFYIIILRIIYIYLYLSQCF